ncbi:MAG: threonylcarbamoyl-AMP synthase [Myxococcaceae bacterium]|jgi:L-threonylcarbamoyladenylate synthase|nr:threonylcarbamoyl-AMP synthase [Myxococcaceae bacterium]MCA3011783.1 threonylcarbamoyl-AMP synthase [Myxococcaceae bacterium]
MRGVRDDVLEAVSALRRGGLVGLPTETVYGLGADASNELAVRRIFAVKGRPSRHPLIVHVACADDARRLAAAWPDEAGVLARAFWPGPLTLVVTRASAVSDAVTGGQDTVGLRVPDHPLALELLSTFGGGVAAPSANRFGRVSPTTAQHVRDELGADVDVVLDGGPCRVGVESTIVDLSRGAPRVLRPGGVPREALEAALGAPVPVVTTATDVRAPGLLASHYAPRAGLSLVSAEALAGEAGRRLRDGATVAALVPAASPTPAGVVRFEVAGDDAAYARALYATLREVDARGLDVVLAVPPPATGVGLAVVDRLRRASAPRAPPDDEGHGAR